MELLQETLQHDIPGEINYCNVVVGVALPWKEPIFRLQLQFSSPCYVGIKNPAFWHDFIFSEYNM